MDDTIYKIALAGYLHDIGKFAERAEVAAHAKTELRPGFFPDVEFLNSNADLYQPHFQGRYTHRHAVYTAAFIDHLEKILPKQFNRGVWGLDDSFVNLAAGHHKPQTPLQWIIAIADRVSSGFERSEFEDYNHEIGVKDYKKTRLFSMFESLSPKDTETSKKPEDYLFRYPLKEISPENIFPVKRADYQLLDSDEIASEYSNLFFRFVSAIENLAHKDNISLWFDHFDSLFMIFASYIPAATVGKLVPDSSLYDHSRMTAALASAFYRYHAATNTMTIERIKDYQEKKLLIITGNLYGIQRFIFTEGGSAGKHTAKILRGRSFAVSLLSELSADLLCKELALTPASVILNAAGKFTLIAHNTPDARNTVHSVEEKINDWLIQKYYGETSFGFSVVEASCDDFTIGKFRLLWDELSKASERKKYRKINLDTYGGARRAYLETFNNDLNKKLCPFCGKRPSSPIVEGDKLLSDEKSACTLCRDHIYIGTNIVKSRKMAVTSIDAALYGDKLAEPIFGIYQISLDVSGKLHELSREGTLIKYWDISGSVEGPAAKEVTAKFINGYVPKYTEEDNTDLRLLYGKKREQTKLELIEALGPGKETPKTFLHIAKKALNPTVVSDKFRGIEALGVLKADVDNLGFLFACGIKSNNLSRMATFSRQMNHYFTIYLPHLLRSRAEFNNVYTVFAGGDDMLLVGPWNRIIDLAAVLQQSFSQYVCFNDAVSLSAGICISKPNEPLRSISEKSEIALHRAKKNGRDSVTVFDETVKWSQLSELNEIKATLESWLARNYINNAMLFRMNYFLRLAQQEKELLRAKVPIELDEMECLTWKALFKYTLARNIGKGLKGEEKERAMKEVEHAANWLMTYGGALKIPIWQIIYNQR